jgi:hypothetical protein
MKAAAKKCSRPSRVGTEFHRGVAVVPKSAEICLPIRAAIGKSGDPGEVDDVHDVRSRVPP